jgi:putative hydrolase of the HAD superfamily
MRESMPKAILFDLGDTLINHRGADAAWKETCRRFAGDVEGLDAEELFSQIMKRRDWFWGDRERHRRGRLDLGVARREIVSLALQPFGATSTELVAKIAASYAALRRVTMELFPGAAETLLSLREQGIRLALVTNGASGPQRTSIDRFGLGPLFDYILIEGEFGVGKPDQRVYLHVLRQLDAQPGETWMVGDNLEWEVAAPQRVGILGIWFNPSGSALPSESTVRPDHIIRTLPELLDSQSDE